MSHVYDHLSLELPADNVPKITPEVWKAKLNALLDDARRRWENFDVSEFREAFDEGFPVHVSIEILAVE